MLTTYIMSEWA